MESKKNWSAKKYKKAADKHYQTCVFLMAQIDKIDPSKQHHIISNLYYLSGYILECIFKFYLLQLEHKNSEYDLKEIESFGLKTHNIKDLWEKQIVIKGDLRKDDYIWTDLTKNWDSFVRYETFRTNYINCESVKNHFNQTVKPIFEKIKDKY